MTAFKAPTEDILFSLRHVADAPASGDWDDDLAADILGHFAGLAEGEIAPLNALGDRQGARLENGRVRMPDGFGAAYQALAEGGWQGLSAPERYGGMGASPLVSCGVWEVFSGANHAMQMVCNLVPGAINTLMRFGSDAQKDAWVPKLASGEVLSTMCLTEAGAGSDLSAILCKAERDGEGWRLTGEKIFISGGDQDLSQGILHLVLARSGGPGIKGLSLFTCPAGPGVRVSRIEEKLGLHASPTCAMMFDGAQAELIGAEGAGLAAMFTLMNHARLDVSLQGVGHAARAWHIASDYAQERTQGRKGDGSPARLSDHADVRRMLDEQRRLALGARAMSHLALVELERGESPSLAEFLTPLCKVFGSEAGIRAADLGIQILGGYGYLEEYGLSQVWRDARITAIYEGANGIHARVTATRGLREGGGSAEFARLVSDLSDGHGAVTRDLARWDAMRQAVCEAEDPTPLAHDFMQAAMQLYFKAVWARIAQVADHHPDGPEITRLSEQVLA